MPPPSRKQPEDPNAGCRLTAGGLAAALVAVAVVGRYAYFALVW